MGHGTTTDINAEKQDMMKEKKNLQQIGIVRNNYYTNFIIGESRCLENHYRISHQILSAISLKNLPINQIITDILCEYR